MNVYEAETLLLDTSYLRRGSPRQQAAATALVSLNLPELVGIQDWALAGTIPLEVDLPGSDLDVLIYAEGPLAARDELAARFADRADLAIWRHSTERNAWCVSFSAGVFPVEFFVQDVPLRQQRAFRHLVTEYRLLDRHGPALREHVADLKKAGLKTEPAFARALGMTGDPYLALLDLSMVEEAMARPRFGAQRSISKVER